MVFQRKKRTLSTIEGSDASATSDHESGSLMEAIPHKKSKRDKLPEFSTDPLESSTVDSKEDINSDESHNFRGTDDNNKKKFFFLNKDPLECGNPLKSPQNNGKNIQTSLEFIKGNNYSNKIGEYNIEKDIVEDQFGRRNSIIEGDDNLINKWHKLQKIAFVKTGDAKIYKPGDDPRDFNVLWRGYIKVLNKACEKTKELSEQNKETSENRNHDNKKKDIINVDSASKEDPELELFDEMTTEEKIMKLNIFLRSEIYYCCYCGIKYKSEQELFEHCPGIKQEDHE